MALYKLQETEPLFYSAVNKTFLGASLDITICLNMILFYPYNSKGNFYPCVFRIKSST